MVIVWTVLVSKWIACHCSCCFCPLQWVDFLPLIGLSLSLAVLQSWSTLLASRISRLQHAVVSEQQSLFWTVLHPFPFLHFSLWPSYNRVFVCHIYLHAYAYDQLGRLHPSVHACITSAFWRAESNSMKKKFLIHYASTSLCGILRTAISFVTSRSLVNTLAYMAKISRRETSPGLWSEYYLRSE